MTPCNSDRTPDYDNLVETGKKLMDAGMPAMVYCGSMGDWPLLTEEQRQEGVRRWWKQAYRPSSEQAQNTSQAVSHAAHAKEVHGLMVIPRVLSGNLSFRPTRSFLGHSGCGILCPPSFTTALIGFETKADLFFDYEGTTRSDRIQGIRRFGFLKLCGRALRAGSRSTLMVRSTPRFCGFLHAGPAERLPVGNACRSGFRRWNVRTGGQRRSEATRLATELNDAMSVLSTFDEGPDLVLYYKELMSLQPVGYDSHFTQAMP